jgi:hypothetical protein
MNEATNALGRDIGEKIFGVFSMMALGPAGLLVNEMIDIDGISKANLMADAAEKAGHIEEADQIRDQIANHLEKKSSFATRGFLKTSWGKSILKGSMTRISDSLNKSNKTWSQIGGSTSISDDSTSISDDTTSKFKYEGKSYEDRDKDKRIGTDTKSREDRMSSAKDPSISEKVAPVQQVTEDRIQAQRDAILDKDGKSDKAAENAIKYRGFKKGGLLKRRTNKNK